MTIIDITFKDQLLKTITSEYETVLARFEDKEQEIQKLREGLNVLESMT